MLGVEPVYGYWAVTIAVWCWVAWLLHYKLGYRKFQQELFGACFGLLVGGLFLSALAILD